MMSPQRVVGREGSSELSSSHLRPRESGADRRTLSGLSCAQLLRNRIQVLGLRSWMANNVCYHGEAHNQKI